MIPAGRDPDDVRRTAEEILARPEFQPPGRSWLERAVDAVGDWLAGVLERLLAPVSGGGGAASWVVLAVLAVGLGAAAVTLVRVVRRGRPRPAERRSGPLVTTTRRRPVAPADLTARAARLATEGRWRDALHARYAALVATLAGRGLLDDHPAATTGDHRSGVSAAAPPASQRFAEAAELFDRAWYGRLPTGEREDARFRDLADAVDEATGPS